MFADFFTKIMKNTQMHKHKPTQRNRVSTVETSLGVNR